MTKSIATLLSAVGHPFLLLPVVFSLLSIRQLDFEKALPALIAVLASLVIMLIFLFFRKKKGKISNWDVSTQKERSRNIYMPILTLVLVVTAVMYVLHLPFVIDTLYFGLLMAVCYAINTRLKISQHTVVAFYLSLLVLPANTWLGIALLLFSPFIAWSRVVLGRHQRNEVLAGAVVGTLFGGLHFVFFG